MFSVTSRRYVYIYPNKRFLLSPERRNYYIIKRAWDSYLIRKKQKKQKSTTDRFNGQYLRVRAFRICCDTIRYILLGYRGISMGNTGLDRAKKKMTQELRNRSDFGLIRMAYQKKKKHEYHTYTIDNRGFCHVLLSHDGVDKVTVYLVYGSKSPVDAVRYVRTIAVSRLLSCYRSKLTVNFS